MTRNHPHRCIAVALHAVAASALVARPKLIVFDLDATLWTPELYKLRRLPNYASAGPPGPMADQDVKLYAGARAALEELATDEAWADTALACASRTNKGPWARQLLKDFTVAGRSLDDLLQYKEIFTGDKMAHFNNLEQKSEIDFDEMLFFDDARDGKYGNCAKVAAMGVCSAHCPDGITTEVWQNALAEFSRLKEAGEGMGTVVDAPGRVPEALPEGLVAASIKMSWSVWKSKFYGAFVLNRRVVLHAIDATPARWRGDVSSSQLDGASAATCTRRTG